MSGLTGYPVALDAALAFGQSSNPANGTSRIGSSCLACAMQSVERAKFG